jgi:hypothetical protein
MPASCNKRATSSSPQLAIMLEQNLRTHYENYLFFNMVSQLKPA